MGRWGSASTGGRNHGPVGRPLTAAGDPAAATSNSPTAVRRSSRQYAPAPVDAPRSAAICRTYVPFEQRTAIVARWASASNATTSSSWTATVLGGGATASPARIRAYDRRPATFTADAAGTAWVISPVSE